MTRMTSIQSRVRLLLSKSKSINFNQALFLVYLCIPLVYIPDRYNLSNAIRTMLLFAITIILISQNGIISRTLNKLKNVNLTNKIIVCFIVVLPFISIVLAQQSLTISIIGTVPVYLGLLSWLCFISLAIVYRNSLIQYLTHWSAIIIFGLVLLLSLIIDNYYLLNGMRISGLLMQSTTLSMYGLVACIAIMYALVSKKPTKTHRLIYYFTLVGILLAIFASHSRIGYLGLIVTFCLFGVRFAKKSKAVSIIIVLVITILPLLVVIQKNYFYRFQSNMIESGSSYRLSMYYISGKDIVKNNPIIGNGPGSLPPAINDRSKVPQDIADTLDQSVIFSSTHNLFLDMAYYFGLLFSFVILVVSVLTLFFGIKSKKNDIYVLSIIFIALFLNTFFNVPSIELTSLYFIVLGSLSYALIFRKKIKNA